MATKAAKPTTMGGNTNAASSLQLSLPQMLDLALGTPEVGAMNMNILHNFLHVLLHQVNLRTTKVEYRGDDASRLQNVVMTTRTGPSLHLHEYSIIESSGRTKQRIQSNEDVTIKADVYMKESKTTPAKGAKGGKPPASAPASARGKTVTEQDSELSLDDKGSSVGTGAKKTKGTKQQVGGGSESEAHSVIFVEPIIDGVVPSALGFKHLEDTIHKLETEFRALEELASSPEMIERIKTNSTDPVSDMWHIINITKRLDAAEKGIDKITTMVQDVIKSDKVMPVGGKSNDFNTNDVGQVDEGVLRQLDEIKTRLSEMERKMANEPPTTGEPKTAAVDSKHSGKIDPESDLDITTLRTEMGQIRKDLTDLAGRITNVESTQKGGNNVAGTTSENSGTPNVGLEGASPDALKTALEGNSKILEQIHDMEVMYGNASQELLQRVQDLEKDVGCLMEKSNSAPMAGVGPEGSQGLGDLLNKIQTIQSDMENINKTANRLIDDRETRDTHTNALLEQIELLKTIKADKEDLEGALADKADAQAVNRKVSYDQFDAACDDLSRGLEDAVMKLNQQEGIWQKALDEVQQEIEGKLDKIEISPLKDFVTTKLKTLQEKLKTLSELRRESEAAGTKKLLRDVQCLSCDKNVVMKMQEVGTVHAEAMPCTRSMKPYLTYELDQVRKQQRRLPHGRNMNQFESAMHEEARKLRAPKDESFAKSPRDHRDHLCNRYCGGSHTVTTPQQRVMRMGHFLTQWGPEAIQLTEGVIRGTDGQMYRSRTLPSGPEVCAPQEAGDQPQQSEEVVAPKSATSQLRPTSSVSARGGDAQETTGRSNLSIKQSGSMNQQRRSSVRRVSSGKLAVERTSVTTPAPKVSEVILEESGSTNETKGGGVQEGAENENGGEIGAGQEAGSEEQPEDTVSVKKDQPSSSNIEETANEPPSPLEGQEAE